ncbi:anthranilate synthase component II [Aureispira anguillae]|uniref:Aminodeoxychorismate/anthranilate synthase component II n=1 Tax=Aureispira anguillae TaxID=2864201 RepID=A0A915YJ71_9BACT|nr:aminodeoxychorismate/anthranilate synthase component II [Aureispira anguillae]BDS14174.1 aminodeoxychorismate/anthranilate synthase component II [Aureispira anguillae]
MMNLKKKLNMKDDMHLLILDNYDSFTYNLYDYFCQLGAKCTVIRNDKISIMELEQFHFGGIVLSPGPQRPANAGILMDVIAHFYTKVPILGICLGMQAIGEYFGAKLVHASIPMHGKTSKIKHNGEALFKNIQNPTQVMRYHSLLLKDLPTCLEPIAWTEHHEIMAIQHQNYSIKGLQFHPESILTIEGLAILENWLSTCVK